VIPERKVSYSSFKPLDFSLQLQRGVESTLPLCLLVV
jgi:hypothetical protein